MQCHVIYFLLGFQNVTNSWANTEHILDNSIWTKGLHGFCLYQIVIAFLSFGTVADYGIFSLYIDSI